MSDLIHWPYDIESYPNVYTAVFKRQNSAQKYIFEVSARKNQSKKFTTFCRWMGSFNNVRGVGFNNLGYDWPVINHCINLRPDGSFGAEEAFAKTHEIIVETHWNDRFKHVIWDNQQSIPQVDLMKMWGFEGPRSMSLKMIEIALRMKTVQDLPYPPGTFLRNDQIPHLIAYNDHDVAATELLLNYTQELIDMRLEIGTELDKNVINKSDVDMGEAIFIEALETDTPGVTGTKSRGPKRTTQRSSINLGGLLFPIIRFDNPEFQRIHQHFLTTPEITQTKGVFDKLVAEAFGMKFKFGTGGIHAATENQTYRSTPTRKTVTVDVASFYPNIAIKFGLHPEHLGQSFVRQYDKLFQRRQTYAKGTNQNTSVKLSLNAVFGKGGSKFSCMHDYNFMLGITINGQLLLCMLAEKLAAVPTAVLFNVNTDGVTMQVDDQYMHMVDAIVKDWENLTNLSLDYDHWESIFQRDVNNYVGVEADTRKIKGKGAFEWRHGLETSANFQPDGSLKYGTKTGNWHKNQSVKIIPMAVEQYLVNNVPIEQTVMQCTDPYLFMHTVKVQKGDRLVLGGYLDTYDDHDTPLKKDADAGRPTARAIHSGGVDQQKTGRFYIGIDGDYLFKIMPPLAKLPNHYRPQAVASGEKTAICNDVHFFNWDNLNRAYYVKKARELAESVGVKTHV